MLSTLPTTCGSWVFSSSWNSDTPKNERKYCVGDHRLTIKFTQCLGPWTYMQLKYIIIQKTATPQLPIWSQWSQPWHWNNLTWLLHTSNCSICFSGSGGFYDVFQPEINSSTMHTYVYRKETSYIFRTGKNEKKLK